MASTPTPMRGTFIPDPPPPRRLSTPARIAVLAGLLLAVILGSRGHTDGQPTPAPSPQNTTAPAAADTANRP
ncbi:hypothetical protein ACIPSE_45380 [Streptomyces sp. NPDC090106]|uniref:hypothetical protein n=1 Tax=Streptomyces sp. NPDC090106 TaxID=3365946 RepID=UPI0037FEB141